MKNRIFKVAMLVMALAFLFAGCKQEKEKIYSSVFDCDYTSEIETHLHTEGVGLEVENDELRLFNVPMLDGTAYCVVQFDKETDAIIKTDCYMEFPKENIMQRSAELKSEFLQMIRKDGGTYEFYPLDNYNEVGESDFLAGNASMELYIRDNSVTWNISWLITGDMASVRLSKSIG